MGKNLSETVRCVQEASDGVFAADHEAIDLEQRAKELRTSSRLARLVAFEAAGNDMVEFWESGSYSPSDILRAQGELVDIDYVRLGSRGRGSSDAATGEKMAAQYELLVPGTPIWYIREAGSGYATTAVVTSDPANFTVRPTAIPWNERSWTKNATPDITFDLDVVNIDKETQEPVEKTIEIDSRSLPTAILGKQAIQALVNEASYKVTYTDRGNTVSNDYDLFRMKHTIDALYQLGMEKLNIRNLNTAIKKSVSTNKALAKAQHRTRWRMGYSDRRRRRA